ncbi:inter-alpha-trypsin inhibitor heavy chain H3-like isoform X2 [Anoplophora glabripennis]|uniref:inter-alpha-trypsin inhibitor heavy chain H3-like isoform X2 n=1 Tax=Anoplophora glabripennis TaxID=217634 RepID=UPI000C769E21|nr:inter-alpha-trypsin inhibitor heavy chain H3-like isoform X2 [Anoplophora glabripennis]
MAEIERYINVFTSAIDRFSKHLHKELRKHNDNSLFSPFGIHTFLTLLSQDSWFYNKDIFNRALHLEVNTASTHYKDMFDVFSNINNFVIANASFLKSNQVQEVFRNRLRDKFASEVNFLDFTTVINTWICDMTHQKIIPFISLRDDVNFTFLNATRFKSNWTEPFSTEDTLPAPFYLNEQNVVQVQMMRKKGNFYFENYAPLDAKILKLPFEGNTVSLVVLLPGKGTNINEFIQKIFFDYNITQFIRNMTKQEVHVSLPKFKMYENLELKQYLSKMGLDDVFHANLSDVIDGEELTCDEIQQKVYLEINEEGAEAAAGMVSTVTTASDEEVPPKGGLIIYEANISSEITNRFAKTKVVWRVKNTNKKAADADFKVILTDMAFITDFVMEIEGKSYKSYIKEKKEAKNIYNEAVAGGHSAGLVEAKTRDSKEFTVSVNLEPDSVVVFSLTYEEMLQRVHDQYELVLNICPGQIVDDLNVEVRINESRPLKFVKTPPLISGNDMNTSEYDQILDPLSDIKIINQRTASIKFHPNAARQRKMTHFLGNKTNDGLSGQFVVQYDVEREPLNGEVLLQDGYFVHFFATNDLDPLPKHVIFVLDTSGSMQGRKIKQLKDAMVNILSDLHKEDMLSIIEFNSDVIIWDVDSKRSATVPAHKITDFNDPFASLQKCILADPRVVSDDIIKKAKEVVQNITATSSTFMIGGLETALYLVKTGQQNNKARDLKLQPIIVFLTDGEPNVGINSTEHITELVTRLNVDIKAPIFSLSFGNDADKNFLRKLSLKNLGFSRHIYEAADASLQLQEFYKQISSPLLHDIKFQYDAEVAEVTRTWFPIYFKGSEFVVAGRCGEQIFPTTIHCCGSHGAVVISSAMENPATSLERLWAYLTVKQLLDERDSSANPGELIRKAVNLALKYNFVTDVTSLVVVKPNETAPVVENRFSYIDRREMSLLCTSFPEVQCSFRRQRKRMLCTTIPKVRYTEEMCPINFSAASPVNQYYCNDKESGTESDYCSLSFDMCSKSIGGQLEGTGAHSDYFMDCSFPYESVSGQLQDMESSDPGKKPVEEFTADHPFLIFLQIERDDAVLILFQGCIFKPSY